eukprot:3147956-Prymnesium_polylepis.1
MDAGERGHRSCGRVAPSTRVASHARHGFRTVRCSGHTTEHRVTRAEWPVRTAVRPRGVHSTLQCVTRSRLSGRALECVAMPVAAHA